MYGYMSKILEFSELLVTRFCHDIAGSVSAVNNGVEFLEGSTDQSLRTKAIELVQENSDLCAIRLKFFRYLYGSSQQFGEINAENFTNMVKDFYKSSKVTLDWSDFDTRIPLVHRSAKMLVSIVYVCSCLLIYGGTIKISMTKNPEGKNITVVATGEKLKNIAKVIQILSDHEMRDIKADNIHIHLASKIATDLGIVPNCSSDDKSFTISMDIEC